jgi:hypothetical protein
LEAASLACGGRFAGRCEGGSESRRERRRKGRGTHLLSLTLAGHVLLVDIIVALYEPRRQLGVATLI